MISGKSGAKVRPCWKIHSIWHTCSYADAETITDSMGNTLATWKAPKPSMKFDQKAWEAATPEDERAKWYNEVQGARRLLIK